MNKYNTENKRIAKNSIFMSIRMIIVLLISLYTTRVVLKILGVEDYGVYNVVCGFVSMFTFLNTSMSNGFQRFLNFELGKNGDSGLNLIFNNAIIIQFILIIIVFLFSESIGLWYLKNKMVIPAERTIAAFWLYQLSIITFVLVILQAPYIAVIMAYERLDFYAILNIFDTSLKLLIVFILPLVSYDRLILYGFLCLLIAIVDFVSYYLYIKVHYSHIHINFEFQKKAFLSMLSFSGWNIFGSFANMMKEQGINLVLNLFCGPVVNAARGVAYQVNAGLQSFVQNITMPVRPQVVQSYARQEYNRTIKLTYSVSKLCCLCIYLLALPIVFEIDYILHWWLGENIPEHTSAFIVIVISVSFINNLNAPISNIVHASGNMRNYQVFTSMAVLSSIPFAYYVLDNNGSPELALSMIFVSMFFTQIVALLILKSIINFSILDYVRNVIYPLVIVFLTTMWIPNILKLFLDESLLRFILVCITSFLSTSVVTYYLCLKDSEREIIKNVLVKLKKIV